VWSTLLALGACAPGARDARVDPHAFGEGTFEVTEPPAPPTTPPGGTTPGTTGTTGTSTVATDGPLGFIGSPCASDEDCPYAGGTCLLDSEGFPRGTCSAPCDLSCEDAPGHATTFCAEIGALPAAVNDLGDGGCVSRCNFQLHPYTGCREGYGCAEATRANDVESTFVCLPQVPSDLPSCLEDLAGRGVPFEPTLVPDAHPAEDPSLTCHVEDPIRMFSGYLGIDLIYHDGEAGGSVVGACSLGHAIADTLEDVSADGATALRHLGTYNCRLISGSSSLSRHGSGDAIDISGFDFEDGTRWTLVDDWEHDTTQFQTDGGEWLYDTAYGWHDQRLWNIVLTPNYNAAHDNHFHVDLTPGSDFIGFTGGAVFGPSPWPDE
jgi:hypothetical protein